MSSTTTRIYTIWGICQDAYLRIGNRKLSWPKDTDPTKTYQWRYLETLNKKFLEWEFSDAMCIAFIEAGVQYAVKNRLLAKGLAIFHQTNIINACYNRIKAQTDQRATIIDQITAAKTWLDTKSQNTPIITTLLTRERDGAYCNLVKWYQSGHLPTCFLAISRSCGSAIRQLPPDERKLIPNDAILFTTQMSLSQDARFMLQMRAILQEDWRQSCRSN